ncbi:MAG: hypothetical protein FJW36_24630 [Acidobacteria bacterium]|nr:hypothetical protein [Acidobacteriota bacterium]
MATQPTKVRSFDGAEYIEGDELQHWRAEVLEEFFRQFPDAFGELTGQIRFEIKALRGTALVAAEDEAFREELLQRFAVRERKVSLAVFACFQRDGEGRMVHRISASHLRLCDEDYLPDLKPFRDAFLAWLGRYNLAIDWVVDELLDCLRSFERHPELYRNGYHGDRDRAGWVVESPPFRFEYRGFELTGEYLGDYLAALETSYKRAITEHLAGIEAKAKQHGLTKARNVEVIHARWLVMRFCRGLSYRDISADGIGGRVTEDAVKKAVQRLAAALDLELPELRKRRKQSNGDK